MKEFFLELGDMIGRKESCASRQLPMISCLFYALEEWTVVEFLKKYLFYVIIGSLTICAILVFFIVPLTIVFFIYLTNILLLIHQRNNELKADPLSDAWNRVRKTIATFWDIYARIWHGLKLLLGVTGVIPGTREECLAALRNGYLVSISPGGVREALFSDQSYQLMWGNRKGFAQVALEAKVGLHPQLWSSQECLNSTVNDVSEAQSVRTLTDCGGYERAPGTDGAAGASPGGCGRRTAPSRQEMTGGNESCTAGPTSMSYLTCLTYILEEWTGVKDIGDYLSAKEMLATLWDGHGRIWHGYELHGVENIPEGPGLVVFYHGATPLDYIYFTARLHVMQKRCCSVVADHFVFRLPGFRILLEVFGVIHGPKEACVGTLEKGHLLAIAPGGVREALFSDEMYTILWSDRKGFAQVAIDAKVPIIPMFTQNVREGFRTLGGIKILRSLYERTRLPVVPLYGGFPVKLRTFIGAPIPYEPNMTAEELAAKTKAAVQALIEKHQKIPGNIFRALMERFQTQKKED
uniref:Transmembrane protein 68 n=1 Tax=Catharus ustulatus TaxID=91951 RepID=A0A8C3U1M2_CATUS